MAPKKVFFLVLLSEFNCFCVDRVWIWFILKDKYCNVYMLLFMNSSEEAELINCVYRQFDFPSVLLQK